MVTSLMQQLQQLYDEGISKDEPDVTKHADKIDVLWDTLKDIEYLLKTIGWSRIYEFSRLLFLSFHQFNQFVVLFRTIWCFSLCACLYSHFGACRESS